MNEIQMTSKKSVRATEEHTETESEADEVYDEKYIDQQLNATVFDDFKQALYEVRYVAPILALLGIILAYHLTIAPYRTRNLDDSGLQQVTDLKTVRPMLSDETLKSIQHIMLRQDNEVELPFPDAGTFSMRFVQSVDKHGTHDLPEMFYEGVMFGVSSGNSHSVEYSRVQPSLSSKALYEELVTMKPTPTHVLRRTATCNNTEWNEKGYGVYFSYKDLAAQGMLSSDKLQPFKRVQDPILWTARKFKQIYITVWYPHQFGEKEVNPPEHRRHKHENIIQMVIPTRTGMDGLRSTAAVWLMERNNTRVEIPPRMVRVNERTLEEEQYVTIDNF